MKDGLKSLKDQLDKTTDPSEVTRLTKAIVDQKNQIQQAQAATNGFANSTFGVSRAARIAHNDLDQTVRSLEGFSRGSSGAADGVSNLIFTFERLKGVTGSTKAALSSIGEALLSPAGLVLALGVGIPLLVEAGQKFLTMASGEAQAKQELDDLTASLKKSSEALQGFNKEIDQSILTRKLKIDIETAPGLNRTLKELQADLDGANLKILNSTTAIDEYDNKLKAVEESTKKVSEAQKDLHFGSIQFSRNKVILENNEKEAALLKKSIDDEKKKLEDSQADVINIPLRIQLAKTDKAREDAKKAAEEAKKEMEKAAKETAKDGFIFFIAPHPEVPSLKDSSDSIFNKLKEDINKKAAAIDIPIIPKIQLHLDEIEKVKKEIKAHVDELNSIVKDGLADVAASFAQGIGQAFATGDVAGIFAGTFKAIGGALQALGKAMIAHAIAVQAFKAAFKNPVAELAAGAGLLIAGAALQAALSKSTKFAKGGIVTGPTNALIGEAGTEVVMPLDRLKGLLGGLAIGGETTVMHKISGNELLLLINRTGKTNNRSF